MGSNPHANGGELLLPLAMPHFRDHARDGAEARRRPGGSHRVLGEFLRDVMKLNLASQNSASLARTRPRRTG